MGSNSNPIPPAATHQDFPIVGVGASAGGLDAFKDFLSAIAPDSGMAYVLVQHLDPSHDSILTEILARYTTIPVHEITDEIHLAPDNIYVIPENKILTSTDGILKLTPRENLKTNYVIDIFFKSLAEIHLKLAVGVVLSGTGTDGTQGLKEIKEHGGKTFAEDPTSSSYSEMPQSAIDAQIVDFILKASDIPRKLVQSMSDKAEQDLLIPTDNKVILQEIVEILSKFSGVDFSHYKNPTVNRRIDRQMAINNTANLAAYLKLLRQDDAIKDALFKDLLISVTSFFRDSKVFNQLSKIVLPALLEKNADSKSIRIWSAGCSTGEEPYSLAIALFELLGENDENFSIKIFASDISENSIAKARSGLYTKAQVSILPNPIVDKYFTKKINGYQISDQIREVCVFATHNLLKDPPFAKMDLITCRNVLIYMDSFLQKKALATFHYALSDGGYLLLGKSETVVQAGSLFIPVTESGKIFARRKAISQFTYEINYKKKEAVRTLKSRMNDKDLLKPDFLKSAEEVLLSTYIPASVIINEQFDVVQFNGNIAPFLRLSHGKATFNLLKIAKEGLAFALRNAIHKAKGSQELTVVDGISLLFEDQYRDVSIKVQPLANTSEPHYLVLFFHSLVDVAMIDRTSSREDEDQKSQKRIRILEKELFQTHEDVKAMTEDIETYNQELQTINEELLSGSEELQTLNEELETSKEELQSRNEELVIINKELHKKQDEISISKEYTEAIIATLREPIVILDTKLRIKNLNNAFATKYNTTNKATKGKFIYEILEGLFENKSLKHLVEKVLSEKVPVENYQISVNLRPETESIMLCNARQIVNKSSSESLILLAIEDITSRKRVEASLQELSDGFENKVKERTSELENSVEALSKANIRLQQLAFIMSHDLQEPVRKILVFASILQQEKFNLSENSAIVVQRIIKASERMKTLISDLLAYSHLKNDDGLFIPTDLNVVLKNILLDFELLIEDKNVEIKIGTLPIVKAIPLQMNQLFYNLISNALKFLKSENRAKIKILSTMLSSSQIENYPQLNKHLSWCEIIFTDNGVGFDGQYEQQIFTMFKRLHDNDIYVGTGMGLSISSKIVENHNGIIFAKSEVNKGAAFHVILPLAAE
jgi:two-component system CheB/CheR fusion protein